MRIRLIGLATLATAAALAGCAETGVYDRSIYKAAVYTPAAVAELKPLSYPVDAVSLTNRPEWAESKIGQNTSVTWDTWITVEPEVRNACARYAKGQVVDRLHQLLGLKPGTEVDRAKARFVRLRVASAQSTGPAGTGIFRPCGNPDPSATSCGNSFQGPDAYGTWFAKQTLGSYTVGPRAADVGYPWTHLGYTYNWDPEAASPRGPQEYVVPAGTVFTVVGVETPEEYCGAR